MIDYLVLNNIHIKHDNRRKKRLLFLCVGHGTYLTSESLVAGVITKRSEPQAVGSNTKRG